MLCNIVLTPINANYIYYLFPICSKIIKTTGLLVKYNYTLKPTVNNKYKIFSKMVKSSCFDLWSCKMCESIKIKTVFHL